MSTYLSKQNRGYLVILIGGVVAVLGFLLLPYYGAPGPFVFAGGSTGIATATGHLAKNVVGVSPSSGSALWVELVIMLAIIGFAVFGITRAGSQWEYRKLGVTAVMIVSLLTLLVVLCIASSGTPSAYNTGFLAFVAGLLAAGIGSGMQLGRL